ncbi:MAG TPA: amidohydrolase family protein [Alphaproteobacteria bacterium]|nr:amidohydrolase family protein [Alphaproteobacteria bacterium]
MAKNRNNLSPSAAVRARLDHPVIDGDGHIVEMNPVLLDYLKQVAGARVARRYEKMMTTGGGPWGWYAQSDGQRRRRRSMRPPFWIMPSRNTLDRATALLPDLMAKRLDDFGIDFVIIYTSMGLPFVSLGDEELRRAVCRALNMMYADVYAGHGTRMTPAAVIPMHTPKEAIEESEFAVRELGLKTVMIAGTVTRAVAHARRRAPEAGVHATWIDPLALDSEYDYDPVWAKFVELKVAPAAHSNSMGWGARATTSNYMYNHIGHFAAAGEAFAKALFFGGVTRRFPNLNFSFLEGGAAWASSLYNDIVEHWEKRNIRALKRNLDPARTDAARLKRLLAKHGGALAKAGRRGGRGDATYGGANRSEPGLDEFAACGLRRAADIKARFVPNFYFGCESDDRLIPAAFNADLHAFGAKMNAMFSSDIGHWDVSDMRTVLSDSYELVETGLLGKRDFRRFVFDNVARLHKGMNPEFFKDTVVEDATARI